MIRTSLKEVENILINLGLEAGDQVLVHADLRVFGRLEGNGAGLIELLEELVGPQGLVCTPSFTFSFPQNFDVKYTKSNIGALTTLFANFKSVVRVPDGMTSYYMLGEKCHELIEKWDHSSYGAGSIIGQLLSNRGKILQLGTDILSPIHYVEELVGVPYRAIKRFEGLIIDEHDSYPSYTDFYARTMEIKKIIPDPIRSAFYLRHPQKIHFNNRELRLFSIEEFVSFAAPRLTENNLILIED
ncbi:AAC(3) family N-acetyltransferase [Porticoccaceae bacterium]|jgi:aminoglycoside 3-N-acetyltransferase|nr:AAC(3) family N-acetyltransferase [Porticoccaceae bacterium]